MKKSDANSSKRLPKDLYLVANRTSNVRAGDNITINIKDKIERIPGQSYYTDLLPKGYKLENYKNKTYLKEDGFDIKKAKRTGELVLAIALLVLTLLALVGISKSAK